LLAAAAFWAPLRWLGVRFFLGLQLPFSPCALPGVGSKPGQQALALLLFLPPFFAADFLPGVFFVSAPVMWRRLDAVLVFADLVAPFAGARFFAADFFAGDFFAAVFFAAVFFAGAFLLADFFAVAMEALEAEAGRHVLYADAGFARISAQS
jgi:hypothetical protein